MSSIVITIESGRPGVTTELGQADSKEAVKRITNFFKALSNGCEEAVVDYQYSSSDPVAASGTFTVVSAIATDAITIGTVTLTASSTPADENEWEIDGADDDADASALAAAINAHSVLSKVVSASAASNVVTVTCLLKGVFGNQIAISSADATITASGTHLENGAGGAENSATTYNLGAV